MFGGHFTFIWKKGKVTYVASLHKWEPRQETRRTLDGLIAGLRKTVR